MVIDLSCMLNNTCDVFIKFYREWKNPEMYVLWVVFVNVRGLIEGNKVFLEPAHLRAMKSFALNMDWNFFAYFLEVIIFFLPFHLMFTYELNKNVY